MSTPLLDLHDALALLSGALPSPVLPEAIADRDDPATDRSAMDGVALRVEDGLMPRMILGTLFAGEDPSPWTVFPGTCLRIMTGAALPQGANAIVPVETIREEQGLVHLQAPPALGAFIRRRAEQAKAGDSLVPAGGFRTAARVGLQAFLGRPLPAAKPLRVAIASTGDEVKAHPTPWQIRDSNGPMLAELVSRLGGEPVLQPCVPDSDPDVEAFLEQACGFPIVLTSGGVSMGAKDLLPKALRRMGAQILFHRLRLKPGKPGLAAILNRTLFLALPGNPVSAYLNARLFLPRALARLQGHPPPELFKSGILATAVPNTDDRPLLHPCRLVDGELHPLPSRGSADLVRLALSDAMAWIPEGGHPGGACNWIEVL